MPLSLQRVYNTPSQFPAPLIAELLRKTFYHLTLPLFLFKWKKYCLIEKEVILLGTGG